MLQMCFARLFIYAYVEQNVKHRRREQFWISVDRRRTEKTDRRSKRNGNALFSVDCVLTSPTTQYLNVCVFLLLLFTTYMYDYSTFKSVQQALASIASKRCTVCTGVPFAIKCPSSAWINCVTAVCNGIHSHISIQILYIWCTSCIIIVI